jgi:glycosyltransferase involved in cell wall biosynthesis
MTASNPSISVLIPCYNGSKTLGASIGSILSQTYEDFECVLIEDGSPDGGKTRQVIESFAAQDERIRAVFHETNLGLAATLNEGLSLARAPLVARLDQDDDALPQRLGVQAKFMEENPEIWVAGSHVYYRGRRQGVDKRVEMPVFHDEIVRVLPSYNCLSHPSVILRKNNILSIGGYRAAFKNAEDYDLWLRVSKVGRLANIPEPLIRYRFSVDGMTLGKKWQQLYYVYLAQLSYSNPDLSADALAPLADEKLKVTDRKTFFDCVVKGTLNELRDLELWWDGLRLILAMRREIGTAAALRHLRAFLSLR